MPETISEIKDGKSSNQLILVPVYLELHFKKIKFFMFLNIKFCGTFQQNRILSF